MHQSRRLSVGVDVPKAAMAGADSAPAPHAAVVSLGHIGTRQGDIDQLLRRLQATSPHLGFGYEAGPCGSWLSRSLPQKAQGCWGVAPSLSPTKPGDRGTTNRQDASKRARLLRAGTLPPVSGPALEEAALRALCRARAEAIRALQTAQCRLTAFLLRHARRAPGRPPGGRPIAEGAARSSVPPPAQQRVLQEDLRAGTAHPARRARLAHERTAHVQTWRLAPVVDALQALRGGPWTVAVTTVAARGARTWVEPPRQRMHSLGCTPAADAPGERRRPGGLPKTGHGHARRALVEGAWASRSPANVRWPLHLRLAKGPKALHESSWQAQLRWGQRSRQRRARGHNAHPVGVAIARKRSALRGAMAQEVTLTP